MNVIYRDPHDLHPYENNPRLIPREAVEKVAASIQTFGFLVPVIVDRKDIVVCGHTPLLAADLLKLEKVPTIVADDLTQDQIRAFRLVDNRVAEMAVWDLPLLDETLEEIGDTIDMTDFGFVPDPEEYVQKDTSVELDESSFDDEEFEFECPECGYKFNEK